MKKSERKEAWVRLLVAIVLGFVAYFWGALAGFLVVLNWLHALVLGARNRFMAEFVELYGVFVYEGVSYVSGLTNVKPFPFRAIKPQRKFDATT